jgi:hypothetical protein
MIEKQEKTSNPTIANYRHRINMFLVVVWITKVTGVTPEIFISSTRSFIEVAVYELTEPIQMLANAEDRIIYKLQNNTTFVAWPQYRYNKSPTLAPKCVRNEDFVG